MLLYLALIYCKGDVSYGQGIISLGVLVIFKLMLLNLALTYYKVWMLVTVGV